MAETAYNFTLAVITSGKLNTPRLAREISESNIVTALNKITTSGLNDFSVYFADALSAGDETILDTIVADHSGEPIEVYRDQVFSGKITGNYWHEIFQDGTASQRITALNIGEIVSIDGIMTAKSANNEVAHWSFNALFLRDSAGDILLKNPESERHYSDNNKLRVGFDVDNTTKEPKILVNGIDSVETTVIANFKIGRVQI